MTLANEDTKSKTTDVVADDKKFIYDDLVIADSTEIAISKFGKRLVLFCHRLDLVCLLLVLLGKSP